MCIYTEIRIWNRCLHAEISYNTRYSEFEIGQLSHAHTNIQKSYDIMEFSLEYYFRLGLQNEIDYS